MRCIIVNDANLKSDAACAHCRNKIAESYIREIGSRRIYCDYHCYEADEKVPAMAPIHRTGLLSSGTFDS